MVRERTGPNGHKKLTITNKLFDNGMHAKKPGSVGSG